MTPKELNIPINYLLYITGGKLKINYKHLLSWIPQKEDLGLFFSNALSGNNENFLYETLALQEQ